MTAQDELNAINEDTPGWVKLPASSKLQLALKKARNSPEYEMEGLRIENEELRNRITILEKRWKVLRIWIRGASLSRQYIDRWLELADKMTEITRKIK